MKKLPDDQIRNEIIALFLDEREIFQRELRRKENEILGLFKNAYKNVAYLALSYPDCSNEGIDLYTKVYNPEIEWFDTAQKEINAINHKFLNTYPEDKLGLEQIKSEITLFDTRFSKIRLQLLNVINQKDFKCNENNQN